jgi:hypothetical protein
VVCFALICYLFVSLQEVQLLGQLIPEECPGEDKPLYGSVVAAVAKVSDTNMYYLADPATGRKVVSRGAHAVGWGERVWKLQGG